MLIASFANPAEADSQAARHPHRLSRPLPGLLVWNDNDRWTDVPAPLLGLQGSIVDRRAGRRVDTAALGGLALFGSMVSRDSAIAGFSKLEAGQIASRSIAASTLATHHGPPASIDAHRLDALTIFAPLRRSKRSNAAKRA
jgi:hypothetical protein